MPTFLLKSSNPGSLICFSNRSSDYFDVTVETPSLKATRKICIYDYGPSNGFVEYFQGLATHKKPWAGEEAWEPLEWGMKLRAVCDALGHVELRTTLAQDLSSTENWSLDCILLFDFGMLPRHAADAKKFMSQ